MTEMQKHTFYCTCVFFHVCNFINSNWQESQGSTDAHTQSHVAHTELWGFLKVKGTLRGFLECVGTMVTESQY